MAHKKTIAPDALWEVAAEKEQKKTTNIFVCKNTKRAKFGLTVLGFCES